MPHSGPVATDRAVGNGATAIDATTFKNGTVTAYCAVDNCNSAKDPPACASRVASNRTIDCRQRSNVIYATAVTSRRVFANGGVLDRQCPDVVGDAAAIGWEKSPNQCLVVVHGGIDDRHGSDVINTGPAVLKAVRGQNRIS